MTLQVSCPSCNEEVSVQAEKCPKCGHPRPGSRFDGKTAEQMKAIEQFAGKADALKAVGGLIALGGGTVWLLSTSIILEILGILIAIVGGLIFLRGWGKRQHV